MAWNRSSESGEADSRPLQKRSGDRFPIRGVIAGTLVVLGAAVAAWWLWPTQERGEDVASTKNPTRIREAKHAAPAKGAKERVRKAAEKPKLAGGAVSSRDEVPLADAPVPAVVREGKEDKRPFKTSTEQALNWIFNAKIGEMPPLPPMEIPKESFPELLKMLERPIEIADEDSDQLAEQKEVVNLAKEELRKYMKEGGDPNEFMKFYREELVRAFDYRLMCVREVEKACDRDAPENVREFFKAVNRHLSEEGLDKIEISEERKAQIELKDEDDESEEGAK